MRALAITGLTLTALLTTAAAFPVLQKRVQEKKAKDFPELVANATKAWEAQSWRDCTSSLKEALTVATGKYMDSIRAAFPSPGAGWEMETPKKNENAAAAMLTAGFAGTVVTGNYRGPESQRMSIQAMLESPAVQMISMAFSNPMMRDDKTELIEYENHKALLTKSSDERCTLKILMGDSLVQVESNGFGDDRMLEIMNQEAVNKIAAAMAK